jgi:hypothetical protein
MLEGEKIEKKLFEKIRGVTMDSPIGVPKNCSRTRIFNRKDLVFFSSKVSSRAYQHFGGEKIEKKSFQKNGWVSMDSPYGKSVIVRLFILKNSIDSASLFVSRSPTRRCSFSRAIFWYKKNFGRKLS